MFELLIVLTTLVGGNTSNFKNEIAPVSQNAAGLEIIKMRVDSEKVNCDSSPSGKCFKVQKESSIGKDSWELLPQEIQGFTFEAGYTYDLVVRIEIQEGKSGAERFKYILEHIVAKVKA